MDCLAHLVSIIKDIVLAGAAAVGAFVAVQGLSTWNRQLKGGVEYDLARRLLKCTYRLREAIRGVRNPVMWAHEMPSPPEQAASGMSADKIRFYGTANAYQKRWDAVSAVRVDLQTELLEAEALWGREVYTKFKPLDSLQLELASKLRLYLEVCNPDNHSRDTYQQAYHQKRDILYDLGDDEKPDDFDSEMSQAVTAIELFLKPHLHQ